MIHNAITFDFEYFRAFSVPGCKKIQTSLHISRLTHLIMNVEFTKFCQEVIFVAMEQFMNNAVFVGQIFLKFPEYILQMCEIQKIIFFIFFYIHKKKYWIRENFPTSGFRWMS